MRRIKGDFRGDNGKMDTRSQRRRAKYENSRQYFDLLESYINIAVHQFDWEGLPETVDQYFLEYTLVVNGRACIVKDKTFGYLGLPCVPMSSQNFYYANTLWKAISVNYDQPFVAITHWNKPMLAPLIEKYNIPEAESALGVVCSDNYEEVPLLDKLEIWVEKLVDGQRTIDVIAKQLKLGSFFETDEKTKMSLQEAINNIDTNIVATFVGNNIAKSLNGTQNFNSDSAAQRLPQAWDHLNNTESRLLTGMGVNNLHTADKKERLLTGEINSNNEFTDWNIEHRLIQRQHFCENMKAAFGLDIKVKIHEMERAVDDGALQLNTGRTGNGNPNPGD